MDYNEEREINKKMIETSKRILSGGNKKLLKESTEGVMAPTQADYQAETSKFKSMITNRVEFTTFNIYPEVNNAVFGGVFQDIAGFEWQFSLETKDGLYITTNNLQTTDDVVARVKMLKGYYDAWADEWADKLATEYKAQNV